MSRTKNLLRGTASEYLTFLVGLFSSFVLVPIILSLAGPAAFGIWATIRSFIGYGRIMDGGLSNAVPRYVAYYHAAEGKEKVKTVVSTSFSAYTSISVIVVGAALILSRNLGLVLNLEGIDASEAGLAMLLAGLALAIRLLAAPLRGTIFGHERLDVVNLIESSSLLFQFALGVGFLMLGLSIVGLALADLLATTAGAVAFLLFIRKKIPYSVPDLRKTDFTLLKEIVSFSGVLFLGAIFMQVIFNTDNIVIGRWVGLSAVAAFAIAFRLVDIARKFIIRLGHALVPFYSQNDARNDNKMSAKAFLELSSVSVMIGMLATLGLALFGGDVIILWVGEENFVGWPTLWALCPFVFIQSVVVPSRVALVSVKRHKSVTAQRGLEAGLNIFLSLVLVREFGVFGVAIATTIGAAVTTLWMMPLTALRQLGIPVKDYLVRVLPNITFGLVLLMLSFLVIDTLPSNLVSIIAAGSVISFLYVGAYYFFFAGSVQKDMVNRMVSVGLRRLQ